MNSEHFSSPDLPSPATAPAEPALLGESVDGLRAFLRLLPAHLTEGELTLAAWYLDAVNEVLEWAQQQVGADPAACLWLGQLRLARLVGLPVFEGAPPMLARPLDAVLASDDAARARAHERLTAEFGRFGASLACERMGTRAHPLREAELGSGVERDGAPVLRALPLALLSYLDEQTRISLMQEAVAISEPWESEWEFLSATLLPVLELGPEDAAQTVENLLVPRRTEAEVLHGLGEGSAPLKEWELVSEQFLGLMTPVGVRPGN